MQTGQGISWDEVLPTFDGWKLAAELQAGDIAFSADGTPATITHTSRAYAPTARLTWDDRTTLSVGIDQTMPVCAGRTGSPTVDRSVAEIARLLSHSTPRKTVIRTAVAGALDMPEEALPVEPYVFGVWIADGKHTNGEISKPDDELFAHIEAAGYEVQTKQPMTRTVYDLRSELARAGVLGHKHIPHDFLWASRRQRLALLQGILDGDGHWNKIRRQAVFSTTDHGLALAFAQLTTSLGWKPRIWTVSRTGFGLTVTAYDVSFTPFGTNPFRLSRKADLVDHDGFARTRRRLLREVVIDGRANSELITLHTSHPSGLLLVGRHMTPISTTS